MGETSCPKTAGNSGKVASSFNDNTKCDESHECMSVTSDVSEVRSVDKTLDDFPFVRLLQKERVRDVNVSDCDGLPDDTDKCLFDGDDNGDIDVADGNETCVVGPADGTNSGDGNAEMDNDCFESVDCVHGGDNGNVIEEGVVGSVENDVRDGMHNVGLL